MPGSIADEQNERAGKNANSRGPRFPNVRRQVGILVKHCVESLASRSSGLITRRRCPLAVDQHVKSKEQDQYGGIHGLIVAEGHMRGADSRWEVHGAVDDRQYEARSCNRSSMAWLGHLAVRMTMFNCSQIMFEGCQAQVQAAVETSRAQCTWAA